jgi:hypothetical protein
LKAKPFYPANRCGGICTGAFPHATKGGLVIDLWERTAALIRAAVYRRRGKQTSASQARRAKARWPHCIRRKKYYIFLHDVLQYGVNYDKLHNKET